MRVAKTTVRITAHPYRVLVPALLAPLLLVSGCSYLPPMPSLPTIGALKPYRIDIQQGNFLSPEMVAQLKPGMTREQVRFVLGTPLVADVFHANRWDYVFYRELGDGRKEQRHLSVFFKDDKLARYSGDVPSVEPKPAAAVDSKAVDSKAVDPKAADPKAAPAQAAAAKPETKD